MPWGGGGIWGTFVTRPITVSPQVYYDPLRRPQATALVDPALVKEIFHQIPEICSVHEHFLKQLTQRVEHWDADRKIGDIFVNTVRDMILLFGGHLTLVGSSDLNGLCI